MSAAERIVEIGPHLAKLEAKYSGTCFSGHGVENFVKFGREVFEKCDRTDRQTDRQTY